MSWCKPIFHLKARGRDNEDSKLNYDDETLRCHKMTGFKKLSGHNLVHIDQ